MPRVILVPGLGLFGLGATASNAAIADDLPKAATLFLMRQYAVDHGADGIRSNAVNADRIRSGLLGDAMIAARAKARGVSSADYMAAVKREAKQLGVEAAMVWAGRRRDIPELLAALDIYVLASLEECFPISVLEAMAAGLPVVATNVGGLPECVVEGVTGHLVPSANPAALAASLTELTRNAPQRDQFGPGHQRRSG